MVEKFAKGTNPANYNSTPATRVDGEPSALEVNQKGSLKVAIDDALGQAQKVTVVGDLTYVAVAPPGTEQATAGWQAYLVTVSGGTTTITWADGNSNYDNVATNLAGLNYL